MATLKTYLMEYVVYGKDGGILKQGKIKAKNKESEFAAKSKFGAHIEKKYGEKFGRLEIKSCTLDNPLNSLFGGDIMDFAKNYKKDSGIDDAMNQFGNIFGKDWKK